jgi:hypothetical protein
VPRPAYVGGTAGWTGRAGKPCWGLGGVPTRRRYTGGVSDPKSTSCGCLPSTASSCFGGGTLPAGTLWNTVACDTRSRSVSKKAIGYGSSTPPPRRDRDQSRARGKLQFWLHSGRSMLGGGDDTGVRPLGSRVSLRHGCFVAGVEPSCNSPASFPSLAHRQPFECSCAQTAGKSR